MWIHFQRTSQKLLNGEFYKKAFSYQVRYFNVGFNLSKSQTLRKSLYFSLEFNQLFQSQLWSTVHRHPSFKTNLPAKDEHAISLESSRFSSLKQISLPYPRQKPQKLLLKILPADFFFYGKQERMHLCVLSEAFLQRKWVWWSWRATLRVPILGPPLIS